MIIISTNKLEKEIKSFSVLADFFWKYILKHGNKLKDMVSDRRTNQSNLLEEITLCGVYRHVPSGEFKLVD